VKGKTHMAKTLAAEQLREAAFEYIKSNPNAKTADIAHATLGGTNDENEKKNRHQRTWFQLRNLAAAKRIRQTSSGVWSVQKERPSPEIDDLPRRSRRPRTTSENGTSAPSVVNGAAIALLHAALELLERSS